MRIPGRRALAAALGTAAASIAVLAVAHGQPPEPAGAPGDLPGCIEPGPCVYVTPDPRTVQDEGTLYTFHGQRWRPGEVTASFSSFCPPDALCDSDSKSATVTADQQGRFTLAIRYHGPPEARTTPGLDGDPRDTRFTQRRDGRRVERDAFPPAPASTAGQRAEAGRLRHAVQRVHRALDRRESAAIRAIDRDMRIVSRCRLEESAGDLDSRSGEVISALTILAYNHAEFTAVRRALRIFAADLRRLNLQDPELRVAAHTWRRLIARPPGWSAKRVCAAKRRWQRDRYAYGKRPVSREDVDRLAFAHMVISSEAVAAGGARLRALGAGRLPSMRFGGYLVESGPHGLFG